MKKDNTVLVMGIIILILFVIIIYGLVVKPVYSKNILAKQQEAYNQGIKDTVNYMLLQIQQQGYTQIFSGNQSMILVPYSGIGNGS